MTISGVAARAFSRESCSRLRGVDPRCSFMTSPTPQSLSPKRTFGREAVAPWLYRTCIERGGRPGVCSDDENAHPCEIGQLRIVRRMTSTVFAWHYSKPRASGPEPAVL